VIVLVGTVARGEKVPPDWTLRSISNEVSFPLLSLQLRTSWAASTSHVRPKVTSRTTPRRILPRAVTGSREGASLL
jgi:hypothetical protein